MLREITSVAADQAEPRRRWFSDKAIELYVWYDDRDEIIQFQMCYDKGPAEKAITWTRDKGFAQHAVDDGESGVFHMKGSPILAERSHTDIAHALKLLIRHGGKLEHDLYRFLTGKLAGDT